MNTNLGRLPLNEKNEVIFYLNKKMRSLSIKEKIEIVVRLKQKIRLSPFGMVLQRKFCVVPSASPLFRLGDWLGGWAALLIENKANSSQLC